MATQGAATVSGPAGRYATALYSYAGDLDRLTPVTANMERLGQLIDENDDLRRLVGSPLTDARDARRALRAVIRDQELGIVARRLIDVLIANRRLPLLRSIVTAFATLSAEKRGIVTAEVATAHPLTDVQEQQLRGRLIEMGHGSVRIERIVDPGLLGGLIVRVGAKLYDSSLKSRLQRLQYAMKGAA